VLVRSLQDLGYGQAEAEPKATFPQMLLPVPEHLRAFDPDVVLVVGDRGTGKSELFNAVFSQHLLPDLAPYAPSLRLPSAETGRILWLAGHPLGAAFADARGLRDALGESDERAVLLWFAYLVRVLADQLPHAVRTGLGPVLDPPAGAPDRVLDGFQTAGNDPLIALDALDRRLEATDAWVFIGYDELDTLGGFHWETMARAVRGLVAFWAGYARRWQRLRPKIFLRSDLFERHTGLGGADLAKLAANRAELSWSRPQLFAMLIKRMANTSPDLYQYCRSAQIRFREDNRVLGRLPQVTTEEDARRLVERMVGPFMGANRNKGQSLNWVVDHLRDGRGSATPRSLVRLFEQAARHALAGAHPAPPALLRPTDLRQALEDVSEDHVRQAIHNEWPWLDGVRARIGAKLAPWERPAILAYLREDWNASWGEGGIRPPAADSRELLDYLISLGVFRERERERIDAPDIYLFGLGLRRRGGVQAGAARPGRGLRRSRRTEARGGQRGRARP
jgi:hypothetical protein